jgi:hypothetical protein
MFYLLCEAELKVPPTALPTFKTKTPPCLTVKPSRNDPSDTIPTTQTAKMCMEALQRYVECGCIWGTVEFRCDLQMEFNTRCRKYQFDGQKMSGYCAEHEEELLDIGEDDWEYHGM